MDLKNALGVVLVLLATAALLFQVVKVGRGLAPVATLINETLHDFALAALGLAMLLRGTPAGDGLAVCSVLLLAAYLTRRYLLRTG